MKKTFNLFKIVKNLFGRKKIADKNTIIKSSFIYPMSSAVIAEIKEEEKVPLKIRTGSHFTHGKFTKVYGVKKKKRNRMQGACRNINHKKAA